VFTILPGNPFTVSALQSTTPAESSTSDEIDQMNMLVGAFSGLGALVEGSYPNHPIS